MYATKTFCLVLLVCSLASCTANSPSQRQNASSTQKSGSEVGQSANAESIPPQGGTVWSGIIPEQAYLTTDFAVHNITVIDTDASMATELAYGLKELNVSFIQAPPSNNKTGFEVRSDDHSYMMIDNTGSLFRNDKRFTVVDQAISNTNLVQSVIGFLQAQEQKQPGYASTHVASITLVTDGDINAADRTSLESFLNNTFGKGHFYLHLIANSPASGTFPEWCQPEAPSTELLSMQAAASPSSLHFSICNPDWYSHFRSIGKRIIYDHAVARIVLPAAASVPGKIPYIRFDGLTFPKDRLTYDPASRTLMFRLVDMPMNYHTIEIGFAP